jgi:hypothetical protein
MIHVKPTIEIRPLAEIRIPIGLSPDDYASLNADEIQYLKDVIEELGVAFLAADRVKTALETREWTDDLKMKVFCMLK